jgi:hypothetical protein
LRARSVVALFSQNLLVEFEFGDQPLGFLNVNFAAGNQAVPVSPF